MSSRFDAETYSLHRPFYPPETFSGLADNIRTRGFSAPFQIADVGCGTGHSTLSLLRAGVSAQIVAVDPDPRMLEQAKKLLASEASVTFQVGSGEATGLETASRDAVIIGSAFHWMNAGSTVQELRRVLKPAGIVRVFEYQFPKAPDLPELNEWIRREFNLRWKAPDQKPRGALRELTSKFLEDTEFKRLGEGRPPMRARLDAPALTGLILSQSRVLHYERTLASDEVERFRHELRNKVSDSLDGKAALFDFNLSWIEYGLKT